MDLVQELKESYRDVVMMLSPWNIGNMVVKAKSFDMDDSRKLWSGVSSRLGCSPNENVKYA